MRKNGYTLIELIAVIALIAVVAIIVILNFDNSVTKSNNKKKNNFKTEIENAACVYIDLKDNASYKSSCYSHNNCSVTASQLINSGMISDELIDPETEQKISPTLSIDVRWDEEGLKTCALNR